MGSKMTKHVTLQSFITSLESVSEANDKDVKVDVEKDLPKNVKEDVDGIDPSKEVKDTVKDTNVKVIPAPKDDGKAVKVDDKEVKVKQDLKEFNVGKKEQDPANDVKGTATELLEKNGSVDTSKDLIEGKPKDVNIVKDKVSNESDELNAIFVGDDVAGKLDDAEYALNEEIQDVSDDIDGYRDVDIALEKFDKLIKRSHAAGRTIPRETAEAIKIALEAFDKEFFKSTIPSLESFSLASSKMRASLEAEENIAKGRSRVVEQIINAIRKIMEAIKSIIKRIKENKALLKNKVDKTIDNIKRKVIKITDIPKGDNPLLYIDSEFIGLDPKAIGELNKTYFDLIEKLAVAGPRAAKVVEDEPLEAFTILKQAVRADEEIRDTGHMGVSFSRAAVTRRLNGNHVVCVGYREEDREVHVMVGIVKEVEMSPEETVAVSDSQCVKALTQVAAYAMHDASSSQLSAIDKLNRLVKEDSETNQLVLIKSILKTIADLETLQSDSNKAYTNKPNEQITKLSDK